MESEVQWLRKRYRSASTDGPTAKKVKYEEIHDDLAAQFPTKTYNSKLVSDVIKAAFPQTYSKPAGKSRMKHIFGLEAASGQGPSTSQATSTEVTRAIVTPDCASVQKELDREREEKAQLLERIKHLEDRVAHLERLQSFSPSHLSNEMKAVMRPGNAAYHGPDTIAHFDTFSIDGVVAELNQFSPDLYQLFKFLGQCGEHGDDIQYSITLDEVKVVTSICTLLKCRSVKVLGLQLLLTLMLLARATSRQVNRL